MFLLVYALNFNHIVLWSKMLSYGSVRCIRTHWNRVKGTVSRDFLLLVFFMNQFPPPPHPTVFHLDRFEIFRKFAEIFASVVDTAGKFATGVNDTGGKLPPVSTTPAANCHRYQRHWRQICHWCQRHRWQIMATISGCRHLKVNLKAKISKYVYSTT